MVLVSTAKHFWWFSIQIWPRPNSLKCLHSYHPKIDHVQIWAQAADIFVLAEFWLIKSVPNKGIILKGYNIQYMAVISTESEAALLYKSHFWSVGNMNY